LVAVGAEPRTRRRFAGATAGLLTLIAAVVAIPAGFLPAAIYQAWKPDRYPVVVPWNAITVVLVGLPLVAGFAAAIVSRKPRTGMLLQPVA
jgi:uncharacterized membrane protein YozB (DUF420 family)